MKLRKKQKKIVQIIMSLGILVFCGFSFFMPVFQTKANYVNEDYDAFDKALMHMIATHSDWDEEQSVSLSSEDYIEENGEVFVNVSAVEGFFDESLIGGAESQISLKKLGSNVQSKKEGSQLKIEKQAEINRLIVRSEKNISSRGAEAVAEYKDYHIMQYSNAEMAKNAYDYYVNLDSVWSVEYDSVIEVDASIEADATTYQSWGWKTKNDLLGANAYINDIQASGLLGGLTETVVAVLDSGINTSHELFQGRILHQYAKNFTEETSTTQYDYEDLNGHGSHVSGTIAEITFLNVKILPLKVLKENGKGLVSGIVNAINYAANVKAKGVNLKLMNMSIGVDASSTNNQVSSTSTSLTNAVKNAYYNSNILSVVSAGNDAKNTSYANPANVDCAITVSALRLNEFFGSSSMVFDSDYSNFGSHVDFAAPGSNIYSAACKKYIARYGENYAVMSGTSMAAPHVTACYALIYSNPYYSSYSFEETNLLLQQNAKDLGDSGRDDYYGYGVINLAKLGLVNSGNVEFSVEEQFHNTQIAVQLSYDYALNDGETLKIFYSTNEDVSTIEPETSSTTKLYSDLYPILITQTTKITAAAFVYDANGVLIQRSYNSSKIYYYDNLDLISNYKLQVYYSEVVIVEYTGELKTLKVPDYFGVYRVAEVGSFAFNNSNVETLYLPATIKYFSVSAFNGNSKIKEIYCESSQIQLGNYAFRWCNALTKVEMKNIISVGEYAFANCTSLETLYLPKVTELGKHCFSETSFEQIVIGKNIKSIGYQTKMSTPTIYGYGNTVAKAFAEDNNCSFFDITLRIEQDLPTRRVIKQEDGLQLTFKYVGLETSPKITFTGASNQIAYTVQDTTEFEKELVISLQNLAEITTCKLQIEVKDYYAQTVNSVNLSVIIVENSRNSYSISYGEGSFKVYVDGELAGEDTKLFENIQYTISVNAVDGHNLEKIWINDVQYASNAAITLSVVEPVQIEVETQELVLLQIDFVLTEGGIVKVGGQEVVQTTIQRYQNLVFAVEENVGYEIEAIFVDGKKISISEDGVYQINSISSNKTIEVRFVEAYYIVKVSLGKGGNISPAELQTSVAKGDSKTYYISMLDGYSLEYVSINGTVIECDGHTFTIDNIDEDCEVYISLKKETDLFGGEFSVIFRYFLVFLGLFLVFVIARILLHYARKEKNKIDKNGYIR